MGKRTTVHHCPGASGWVGDQSPGGCNKGTFGSRKINYCKKHEMPCRNGCDNKKHLKNRDGCKSCEGAWEAAARNGEQAKQSDKETEKSKENEAFWHPGKDNKKLKK
ncbi:hypothetical protein AALT_g5380 [Alternaria alternata]|nr:hypothetical protein AALT_g5380 [Alternaria alternata]